MRSRMAFVGEGLKERENEFRPQTSFFALRREKNVSIVKNKKKTESHRRKYNQRERNIINIRRGQRRRDYYNTCVQYIQKFTSFSHTQIVKTRTKIFFIPPLSPF